VGKRYAAEMRCAAAEDATLRRRKSNSVLASDGGTHYSPSQAKVKSQ